MPAWPHQRFITECEEDDRRSEDLSIFERSTKYDKMVWNHMIENFVFKRIQLVMQHVSEMTRQQIS